VARFIPHAFANDKARLAVFMQSDVAQSVAIL